MGFNMTGAVAGLLGEYGNQAGKMVERRQEIEQRKLEQAMADRKEQAALAKQEALMKYNYYREDQKDIRDQKRIDAQAARDDKRYAAQNDMLDKRMSAQEAAAERRHHQSLAKGGGSDKPSATAEKLQMIENDPDLSPEEKIAAKKAIYGLEGKGGKGGLTDYQMMQADEKLAEIEVTDDVSMKQYNAIAKYAGRPQLKKVEKTAGRKGILGIGSKEPEFEYVEDWEGMGEKEDVSVKPESQKGEAKGEAQAAPIPKANIKDTAMELLRKGQKGQDPEPGIAAPVKEPASTDIGSVLGTIVNGGVTAVKKIAAGGQDLKELEGQFLGQLKNAREQEKSAILKAIAAVRQVMMTETNPEAELRSRAFAPR